MSAPFEKTSIPWQIQQMGQRLGEWLEQLFAPVGNVRPPDWLLPEWLLRSLFWAITIPLIGWVGWQLYQLLRPYWGLLGSERATAATAAKPEPESTAAQWLQRSRTYARQQNYREACRCLYYATLQHLDEVKLISQERSRTDGEYRNLLQTIPNPRPYQVLINTHEQLCFGNGEVSAQEFDHCQQAYQEILADH